MAARWLEISMRWNELDQEICSLARTMSVIGDRWTILILRECFMKVRRFEDFQSRLGISRGVLAERLHGLTDNFILTKVARSEEHTSELQSLMRISYAVFCLKKKKKHTP